MKLYTSQYYFINRNIQQYIKFSAVVKFNPPVLAFREYLGAIGKCKFGVLDSVLGPSKTCQFLIRLNEYF